MGMQALISFFATNKFLAPVRYYPSFFFPISMFLVAYFQ